MHKFFHILLLIFALTGCSEDKSAPAPETNIPLPAPSLSSCRDCHNFSLDANHAFACKECHQGQNPAQGKDEAHEGMISAPAHPDAMAATCGRCHESIVTKARQALHFTLYNKVNIIRAAFGAKKRVASLTEIPIHPELDSPLALADDLLRRNCLRCHLYFEGDSYPATRHGTGCAACHLSFAHGTLKSHQFLSSPTDKQCLSCHYGNFVGADYFGRFEHDFHWDYRTPYTSAGPPPRDFGVEYHQLVPDIHSSKGLLCIDCHSGHELMAERDTTISCESCHQVDQEKALPQNLRQDTSIILIRKKDGRQLVVPQLSHPAHELYTNKAHCSVCHAQWSFTDQGIHLLRQDAENYDPWAALTVQGNYEVEDQLETNLFSDEEYPLPFMADKISGQNKLGIWLKGYGQRRWEFPIICRDEKDILHVCRPILDLSLSYTDQDENVVFDALKPLQTPIHGLLPYTPHTTGKAGSFFYLRLRDTSRLMKKPYNLTRINRESD